jgi:uncharacterized membrane protein
MKRFHIGHHLKTSLWVVPMLFVLAAVGLSVLTTSLDQGRLISQSITGDPHAALQILYLIAFATLTLTGLVLSLLVVAVQLAMGTFSPRIVRQILQDRPSQSAIGLLAATFTFSLLSMRAVRTTNNGGTVPGLSVIVAMVLALFCIATLVWYLNHIAQSLRTAALVAWVAEDTLTTLDRVYPDGGEEPDVAPDVIPAADSGVIFTISYHRLVTLAERADCRLDLLFSVGDFVPAGAPLVRVAGPRDQPSPAAVIRCIVLGPERTLNEDVAYGIRMLVDIAERSLSSGPFEDPTTAVQAIDRLHDILRRIARRPIHSGEYRDADGVPRVRVPTLQWDGFVRLAFDELRQAGAASPQVARRLTAALHDLLKVAPETRRPVLRRQLVLLHEQATRVAPSHADGQAALESDPAGIGSAAALVAPSLDDHQDPSSRAQDRAS